MIAFFSAIGEGGSGGCDYYTGSVVHPNTSSRRARLLTDNRERGASVRLCQVAKHGEISRFVNLGPWGSLAEVFHLLNDTKPLSIVSPKSVCEIGNDPHIGIGIFS